MRLPFLFFICFTLAGLSYVLWHVWTVLPIGKVGKWTAVVLFAVVFFSMFFFIGGLLEKMPLDLASIAYKVSTSAIIVLLYLTIIFIVLDVARLLHLLPAGWLRDSWVTTVAVTVVLAVTLIAGNIKYHHKTRVPLQLSTDKPISRDYRIVMMSDLHLGYHNRRSDLARWVDLINAEHPDLILIAGDIIDNSLRPLNEENMAEEFRRLTAPVYACLGNHEYFSRGAGAKEFWQAAGIHLLVDSTATIGRDITLICRNDRFYRRRKELKELMSHVPDSTFNIILDHQPFNLEQAGESHADFQLSGHTHRGQVWPVSWVTDMIYECSWGSCTKGNTQFYVSSGLGIWGGKYRIGTQSEYVVATLNRNKN